MVVWAGLTVPTCYWLKAEVKKNPWKIAVTLKNVCAFVYLFFLSLLEINVGMCVLHFKNNNSLPFITSEIDGFNSYWYRLQYNLMKWEMVDLMIKTLLIKTSMIQNVFLIKKKNFFIKLYGHHFITNHGN